MIIIDDEGIMHNVIPIPKDATNGDMIKALFPDAEVHRYEWDEDMEIYEYEIDIDDGTPFSSKWWNAKYEYKEKQDV